MRWNPEAPLSHNLEDRRGEVHPQPTAPDAMLRGMPQTAAEWALFQQHVAAQQQAAAEQPTPEGAPQYPVAGDPAGIEAARMQYAARQQEAALGRGGPVGTAALPLEDGGVRGGGNQRPSRPLQVAQGSSTKPGRPVYEQQNAAQLAAFRAKLGL